MEQSRYYDDKSLPTCNLSLRGKLLQQTDVMAEPASHPDNARAGPIDFSGVPAANDGMRKSAVSARQAGSPAHPRRNRTPFAILGILALGPRTGYDIRQMMAVSTGFFWNESFGQIYPILGQLNKDGLIEALQAEVVGRRARQQYRITEAGLQRLGAWLREPVQHSPIRNELLLKLFFGANTDIAIAVAHLEQRRERAHDTLRAYENARASMRASRRADPAHRVYYEATLNYGVAVETAVLSWVEATLTSLGQQTGVAKAG